MYTTICTHLLNLILKTIPGPPMLCSIFIHIFVEFYCNEMDSNATKFELNADPPYSIQYFYVWI